MRVIKKEGEYADYLTSRIVCDYLQRPVHLYEQTISEKNLHIFNSETNPYNKEPIHMLFTGKYRGGHYLALLIKKVSEKKEEDKIQDQKEELKT